MHYIVSTHTNVSISSVFTLEYWTMCQSTKNAPNSNQSINWGLTSVSMLVDSFGDGKRRTKNKKIKNKIGQFSERQAGK